MQINRLINKEKHFSYLYWNIINANNMISKTIYRLLEIFHNSRAEPVTSYSVRYSNPMPLIRAQRPAPAIDLRLGSRVQTIYTLESASVLYSFICFCVTILPSIKSQKPSQRLGHNKIETERTQFIVLSLSLSLNGIFSF